MGRGPGRGRLGGRSWGDPHLLVSPEESAAMLGADMLGGRRAGGVGGSLAAPAPGEGTELPAPLSLIAWRRPCPMWPFLRMIKAS